MFSQLCANITLFDIILRANMSVGNVSKNCLVTACLFLNE